MTKARDLANSADVFDTVSTTELGYLDGVSSAIQTQIDGKQAVVSGVDNTEIGYLDGVTSAIQTQLDGKVAASTVDAKGDLLAGSADNTLSRLAVGANDTVLTADSSTSTGLKWATPAGGGGSLPTFSAYDTTTQSINANVYTKITFTSENWDSDSAFASSRFTPQTAGYYSVSAMIGANFGTAEDTYWQVYKNGASWQMGSLLKTTGNNYASGHILVYLNGSTDYIEIYGSSSNNATIGGTAATRYFAAIGIRS